MIVGVTGSTGFLGRYVVRALSCVSDMRIFALTRRAACQTSEAVVPVVADQLFPLSAATWRGAGVSEMDVLIHLAAATPKSQSEGVTNRELFSLNYDMTARLLESLPSAPRRLLFASAIDVYGPDIRGERLTEKSDVRPRGPYGEAKVAGEQLCNQYADANQTDLVILRYGHLYGAGEDAYQKLIPVTIRRAIEGGPVEILGSGSVLRDLLHASDAAEATYRAMFATVPPDRVVNVVRGESVTVESVVRAIAELAGCKLIMSERPASEQRDLVFDAGVLRNFVGNWSHIPLSQGLEEEYRYMATRYG